MQLVAIIMPGVHSAADVGLQDSTTTEDLARLLVRKVRDGRVSTDGSGSTPQRLFEEAHVISAPPSKVFYIWHELTCTIRRQRELVAKSRLKQAQQWKSSFLDCWHCYACDLKQKRESVGQIA